MNTWEFYDFAKGKTGSIYVARKGTVTVVEIGGTTYLLNNTSAPGAVIVNPADMYWVRSIDWAGGFSDYFAMGMCPEETPRIKAKPILEITIEQKEKLLEMAQYLQRGRG